MLLLMEINKSKSKSNNDEEVRCKTISEYRNRVRRALRSKLSSKNKVTAINTFAVPFTRYPATVVNWRREDLKETDIGNESTIYLGCQYTGNSVHKGKSGRQHKI